MVCCPYDACPPLRGTGTAARSRYRARTVEVGGQELRANVNLPLLLGGSLIFGGIRRRRKA